MFKIFCLYYIKNPNFSLLFNKIGLQNFNLFNMKILTINKYLRYYLDLYFLT